MIQAMGWDQNTVKTRTWVLPSGRTGGTSQREKEESKVPKGGESEPNSGFGNNKKEKMVFE